MVRHLTDVCPADTPDVEWIGRLASDPPWTVVSGDIQMTRTKQEAEAWRRSGLTVFFLKGWANHTLWEQAWRIVRVWPTIVKQAELVPQRGTFTVSINLKLETLRL